MVSKLLTLKIGRTFVYFKQMNNEDNKQQRELLILIKEVDDLDALLKILNKGIPLIGKATNTEAQEKIPPKAGGGELQQKKPHSKPDLKGRTYVFQKRVPVCLVMTFIRKKVKKYTVHFPSCFDHRPKAASRGGWFCTFRHTKLFLENHSSGAYEDRLHFSQQSI